MNIRTRYLLAVTAAVVAGLVAPACDDEKSVAPVDKQVVAEPETLCVASVGPDRGCVGGSILLPRSLRNITADTLTYNWSVHQIGGDPTIGSKTGSVRLYPGTELNSSISTPISVSSAIGIADIELVVAVDGEVVCRDTSTVEVYACPTCNCYFSNDCLPGFLCGRAPGNDRRSEDFCLFRNPKPNGVPGTGCNVDDEGHNNCDGLCQPMAEGSICGSEDRAVLVSAIELWANAMTITAENGGGLMSDELLDPIRSLPFANPAAYELLGRHTGSVVVLARGEAFMTHPPHDHDFEDHIISDYSSDSCRLAAGDLVIDALLAELATPGSGADVVAKIPQVCPDWQTMFEPMCAGPDPLDCVARHIADMATYLTLPRVEP